MRERRSSFVIAVACFQACCGLAVLFFESDAHRAAAQETAGEESASVIQDDPPQAPDSQTDEPSLPIRVGTVLIVVGPGGEPKYDEQFAAWGAKWRELATQGGLESVLVESQPDQAVQLKAAIEQLPTGVSGAHWLVLIGHGSFDGRTAKFNLQGPDLDPAALSEQLSNVAGTWVVIQGAASSGPFLEALADENRIVITATRSGNEASAARWHQHLLEALLNREGDGDLDQDEQVSVYEAFVSASRAVAAWYAAEKRLATEHALLDDNGDGKGVSAEELETGDSATAVLDGDLAKRVILIPSAWERAQSPEWLATRDLLEQELARARRELSESEDEVSEADAKAKLRDVLNRLSAHYASTSF